eukprot:COSAG03_NODE_5435_length_1249_cov_47.210435_2_plen_121_part_00
MRYSFTGVAIGHGKIKHRVWDPKPVNRWGDVVLISSQNQVVLPSFLLPYLTAVKKHKFLRHPNSFIDAALEYERKPKTEKSKEEFRRASAQSYGDSLTGNHYRNKRTTVGKNVYGNGGKH